MWITYTIQSEEPNTGVDSYSHMQWQLTHAMTVTTVLVYIDQVYTVPL